MEILLHVRFSNEQVYLCWVYFTHIVGTILRDWDRDISVPFEPSSRMLQGFVLLKCLVVSINFTCHCPPKMPMTYRLRSVVLNANARGTTLSRGQLKIGVTIFELESQSATITRPAYSPTAIRWIGLSPKFTARHVTSVPLERRFE